MNYESSIYWIEGPWKGRLAIVPRPRGGDWLDDEAAAWKQEGVNTIVSTLMDDEIEDFDLRCEGATSKKQGLEFVAYPIPDRGVPPSMKGASALLGDLEKKLSNGKNVVIHCRQGIGRSAVLSVSLLILAGVGRGHGRSARGRRARLPGAGNTRAARVAASVRQRST